MFFMVHGVHLHTQILYTIAGEKNDNEVVGKVVNPRLMD